MGLRSPLLRKSNRVVDGGGEEKDFEGIGIRIRKIFLLEKKTQNADPKAVMRPNKRVRDQIWTLTCRHDSSGALHCIQTVSCAAFQVPTFTELIFVLPISRLRS